MPEELPHEVIDFIEELVAEGYDPEEIANLLTDEEFLAELQSTGPYWHALAKMTKPRPKFDPKNKASWTAMHKLAYHGSDLQKTHQAARGKADAAAKADRDAKKGPSVLDRAKKAIHAFRDNSKPSASSGGSWVDKMRESKKTGFKLGSGGGAYHPESVQLAEGGPTKKHFIETAKIVAAIGNPKKRQEFADHHASIYAHENPRFDHGKWHKACGTKHTGKMNEGYYKEKDIERQEKETKDNPRKSKSYWKAKGVVAVKKAKKGGKSCTEAQMYEGLKTGKLAWGGVSDLLAEVALKNLWKIDGKDRKGVLEVVYHDREAFNRLLKQGK